MGQRKAIWGSASANHNWDNTVAILAGDFTLARASEVAAESLGQAGVILLAQTYAQLCEGQVLELQRSLQARMPLETR